LANVKSVRSPCGFGPSWMKPNWIFLNMPLVIGPLDGLGLEMHVGHGLGLAHDLGLGVAQAISLIGITSLGPYQITRRIGPVAYEIAQPPQLANLHLVFHVSQLRKYVFDLTHVLEVEDIQIREDLNVEVPPITLEERKVEERRGKAVSLVKVIWDRRTGDSTWELEEDMRKSHPHLFTWWVFIFEDENFCCCRECKAH